MSDDPPVRNRRLFWLSVVLLALPGCGGGSKPSLAVSVTDRNGLPIVSATVSVTGTTLSAASDASGNARLSGLKSGIYRVVASADGYLPVYDEVTIQQGQQQSPVSLTLPFLPPTGSWVTHPKSTLWQVLTIDDNGSSGRPFHASVENVEWHCILGNWSRDSWDVTFDEQADALSTGPSIIGPYRLATTNSDRRGWVGEARAEPLPSTSAPGTGLCTSGYLPVWDGTG